MESEDAIKREFKAGELPFIDAIRRLENMGYDPKDAEAMVEAWDLQDK